MSFQICVPLPWDKVRLLLRTRACFLRYFFRILKITRNTKFRYFLQCSAHQFEQWRGPEPTKVVVTFEKTMLKSNWHQAVASLRQPAGRNA